VKILIADKFQPSGIAALKELGCEVVSNPDLAPDTLPDAVVQHDPDILIVRSTKVPAPVFDRAKKLALVIRAGAGYDTIDVEAASARGIFVSNCPGKNSIAVAELTWGLILACDRRIAEQSADLKAGRWDKKTYSKAQGIYGRTLGIIGVGQIGEAVIERAHAFGTPVVAWSRSLTDATARELGVTRANSPIEVAKISDIVTLHVAATPETKALANKDFFDAMKPGAIFINTTRGSVVDESALHAAIKEKNIRAGLDVFAHEPGASDNASDIPVAREPAVTGTHHIGASTEQAQEAIATEAVRIVTEYKHSGHIPNVVNRQGKSRATRLLSIRHLNKPGVLAHVVGEIGKARINIEEMENIIYSGGFAACARIQLDAEPTQETMDRINSGSEHVLSVDLTVIE